MSPAVDGRRVLSTGPVEVVLLTVCLLGVVSAVVSRRAGVLSLREALLAPAVSLVLPVVGSAVAIAMLWRAGASTAGGPWCPVPEGTLALVVSVVVLLARVAAAVLTHLAGLLALPCGVLLVVATGTAAERDARDVGPAAPSPSEGTLSAT